MTTPKLLDSIKKELRYQLLTDQNNQCYWCDREMKAPGATYRTSKGRKMPEPLAATLGHFIPRDEGGSNNITNLLVCCYDCHKNRW